MNLPAVASISITLKSLYTETELQFKPSLQSDNLLLNNKPATEKERLRLSSFLNKIRQLAGHKYYAMVKSDNNFPISAGLASSASSFASLALAGSKAAGLSLSTLELSALARQGSGSAARSIFGGFVEMNMGKKSDGSDAYAHQIFPENYWNLNILIAITSKEKKSTGSGDGMEISRLTSPYYDAWVQSSAKDITEIRDAISKKDFRKMAEVSEYSCLKMHALAMASNPGIIYWNGITLNLIHKIREMRSQGIPVFFTIDAGPQVKAICPAGYSEQVKAKLVEEKGIHSIIESGLGGDAEILEEK